VDKETRTPVANLSLDQGDHVTLFGPAQHSRATFVGWKTKDEIRIGVNCEQLGDAAPVGGLVCMHDGGVRLEVLKRLSNSELLCQVLSTCCVGSRKRVFLPNAGSPALTKEDMSSLQWAVSCGASFVTAAVTRSADDVLALRDAVYTVAAGDQVR
jgi:pyruvate kinase